MAHRLSSLQQCHRTSCGKSNTPPVFQVTRVSYYCVSYPPVYSCKKREGGMQWWRSRDLLHSTGGLCRRLLVPVWEIRERHEEAS